MHIITSVLYPTAIHYLQLTYGPNGPSQEPVISCRRKIGLEGYLEFAAPARILFLVVCKPQLTDAYPYEIVLAIEQGLKSRTFDHRTA